MKPSGIRIAGYLVKQTPSFRTTAADSVPVVLGISYHQQLSTEFTPSGWHQLADLQFGSNYCYWFEFILFLTTVCKWMMGVLWAHYGRGQFYRVSCLPPLLPGFQGLYSCHQACVTTEQLLLRVYLYPCYFMFGFRKLQPENKQNFQTYLLIKIRSN